MDSPRLHRTLAEAFHELSLLLFSALASAAAGTATAWWVVVLEEGLTAPVPRELAGMATLLMGAGLLSSLLHLGRPLRMLKALSGLRTSYLSWEVLLAGGFLLLAGSGWVLLPGRAGLLAWLAACCCGPLFFAALGQVYRLRGQLTWGYPASLSMFLLGTAAGILIIHQVHPGAAGIGPAVLLLTADLLLAAGRWRWYGTRLVLADLMPLLYLLAPGGDAFTAAVFLLLGLLADRFAFYGLAVRRSTASELARVEHLIRHMSP